MRYRLVRANVIFLWYTIISSFSELECKSLCTMYLLYQVKNQGEAETNEEIGKDERNHPRKLFLERKMRMLMPVDSGIRVNEI